MSLFVDQLVKDLKENPLTFTITASQYGRTVITKGNLVIKGYGNPRLLSVIEVEVNYRLLPLTYCDCWKLEGAVKNWHKSIPLEHLLK